MLENLLNQYQICIFFSLQILRLSKGALSKFSEGQVINLVSNDVQRLEWDTVRNFFFGVISFLELLAGTFLLVYLIGWQTLMGVIFIFLLLPYFGSLSFASASLRLRSAEASDKRISLINQVIAGIRAIKINAWEDVFREKIKDTRRQENQPYEVVISVKRMKFMYILIVQDKKFHRRVFTMKAVFVFKITTNAVICIYILSQLSSDATQILYCIPAIQSRPLYDATSLN